MNISLQGKTALVCGSSQGIGLATAIELAALGATCILTARNEARLKAAVAQLAADTGQAHRYIVSDFSDPGEVTDLAADLALEGPVHILVNNTGGPAAGPILEAPTSAFADAFSQHVLCNQILAQALVPGMISAGYGRIINIVSTSVKAPLKNLGVSNTTRWAVAAWAKTLANELAQHGITVNNVLPGSTLTDRLEKLFNAAAAARNVSPDTVAEEWRNEIPMKRFGEAHEIAAMAAFLASPAASYVTGTSIAVDGGKTPVS
ncbi:3-oxoacyl-[acyl-carrier protein] reductase [Chitinophaga eiseniae]|uniref:3-oxoacyl-[acyl-carrier protein] reductase n=1 Tax=Chitinophaga eiseniae TaxID=634771 RepID=A0A1T4KCT0_9BACT|nr:SDR family oxidoreductase [Chitinophaga eiseniae]SJZ40258.1 3-oxoacyl-[acyl-carrier protein] reductase [Chitinophaga eiseniae]